MENSFTIRPLLKKDQRRVSAMLAQLADKIDDKSILHIIESTGARAREGEETTDAERQTRIIRVFIDLFKRLIAGMHDEVVEWFAELIGVSVEQYYELPIDIDVQILEQIKDRPEISNFFTGALRLYSGTQWFKSTWENLKTKYASAVGSLNDK